MSIFVRSNITVAGVSFCTRHPGHGLDFSQFLGSEIIRPTSESRVTELACPAEANAVRVACSYACLVDIGQEPDALGSRAVLVPEHSSEFFGCRPGDRVAVALISGCLSPSD